MSLDTANRSHGALRLVRHRASRCSKEQTAGPPVRAAGHGSRKTPALHAQVVQHIHPELLVRSWWAFMFRMFILRPLVRGQPSTTFPAQAPVGAAARHSSPEAPAT